MKIEMTTPTRKQVVQWARDAQGSFSDGLVLQAWLPFMTRLTELARADLEATIAEQSGEIERWQNDCRTFHKEMVKRESAILELRQQLAAEQAYAEQLREDLKRVFLKVTKGFVTTEWAFVSKALSIPSSADALREYGAKLVERIAEMLESGVPVYMSDVADKIRKGEFK